MQDFEWIFYNKFKESKSSNTRYYKQAHMVEPLSQFESIKKAANDLLMSVTNQKIDQSMAKETIR